MIAVTLGLLFVIISVYTLLVWLIRTRLYDSQSCSRPRPILLHKGSPPTPLKHIVEARLEENASHDLSLVIPAYNEAFRLPPMLAEALHYLNDRASSSEELIEVIIVDDGSTDLTVQVVIDMANNYKGRLDVKLLIIPKNTGKGNAIIQGIRCSMGQKILFLDADGSTPISELEILEEYIKDETEPVIVCGSRMVTSNNTSLLNRHVTKSLIRRILSAGFSMALRMVVSCPTVLDSQCGFKLLSRPAAQIIIPKCRVRGWAFDVELLYLGQLSGVKVIEVPVSWTEKTGSKLSLVRDSAIMAFDVLCMGLLH